MTATLLSTVSTLAECRSRPRKLIPVLNIALDAISEFRVSTAVYTAESGAAGGAQINVISKSGSNSYHGSAFYALRNDALDARSPFDDPTTGLPPFSLHQFGGSIGGPIKKDKAFFYANYEGLRQSLGQTFINFVPNAAYRAQVLAKSPELQADNRCLSYRWDSR
jgi:hypothetical protein